MKGLELPVFHETPATEQMASLGMVSDITLCDVGMITFYNINGIGSFKNTDGTEYGAVFFNGEDVVTTLPYRELQRKVEEWTK